MNYVHHNPVRHGFVKAARDWPYSSFAAWIERGVYESHWGSDEMPPMPDWAAVHRELRRPNVTLSLLWEEYRDGAGAQDGFGYSWFCDLYRDWAGRLKPTMRQTHVAGEKLFVDFAGRTAEVVDGLTGEIIPVQIFVAVLGASSFTLSEASAALP